MVREALEGDYRCVARGCDLSGKSVPRAKMEDGFEEILRDLQPAKSLFELAKVMIKDAWDARLVMAHGDKDASKK